MIWEILVFIFVIFAIQLKHRKIRLFIKNFMYWLIWFASTLFVSFCATYRDFNARIKFLKFARQKYDNEIEIFLEFINKINVICNCTVLNICTYQKPQLWLSSSTPDRLFSSISYQNLSALSFLYSLFFKAFRK